MTTYEVEQCTRDAMCICVINIFNAVSVEMEGESKRRTLEQLSMLSKMIMSDTDFKPIK